MAAKPPKPPGNFFKSNKSNENNSNRTVSGISETVSSVSNLCKNFNSAIQRTNKNTTFENKELQNGTEELLLTATTTNNTSPTSQTAATELARKSNCDCTNISIMHLFHEMKQEFPTIPDQIVAQYVSENCHQRDNCLQILRNELALHPMPVQTYPAKVLQQQQKRFLKPNRKAPIPIPTPSATPTPTSTPAATPASTTSTSPTASTIMPIIKIGQSGNSQHVKYQAKQVEPVKTNEQKPAIAQCAQEGEELPPVRPTFLNLFGPQQHFKHVQVELKQELKQRNQLLQQQQQQEQQQPPQSNSPTHAGKPLRKAPLPPIPPKPTNLVGAPPFNMLNPAPVHIHHNSSIKIDSPTATGEAAEISVNVSVSSPTTTIPPNKSPSPSISPRGTVKPQVRHRAEVNVQPQPPYARGFNAAASPTSPSGQKSFTTVNLTLRPPGSAVAASQATIDISAGPGVSGPGGSGMMYSSTSYNATQGYQKNFCITVSDTGGEISASRFNAPNAVGDLAGLPTYNNPQPQFNQNHSASDYNQTIAEEDGNLYTYFWFDHFLFRNP